MTVSWNIIKDRVAAAKAQIHYVELENQYLIKAVDNIFQLDCILDKNPTDPTDLNDFETNYKPTANKPATNLSQPFSAKEIPGYKLYRRVHGQTATLNSEGDTTVQFPVPYALCKIDEIQMFWAPEGITCDFTVEHPIAGPLSQHAFGVPVAKDHHTDRSSYDATLQAGLILKVTFHNTTTETKAIGIAWVLHEMVAI